MVPTLQDYVDDIKAMCPSKIWRNGDLDKRAKNRMDLHQRFPYIITYKGHYNPGILDDMDEWCCEQFGRKHGECYCDHCEWENVDHSHTGKWSSYFVIKTGYDYGYQDYCFENEEDAFYFKIIWDEEASKK